MDKTMNYLGIARKSGKIEIGETNAKAAVKSGKGTLMLLAKDCSDHASRRAEGYVFGTGAELFRLPYTKEELSLLLGKAGCSMMTITDRGLAAAIRKTLGAAAQSEKTGGNANEQFG